MSTSGQQGSRIIRTFSDVETPFLFSDLAVEAAKSENKRGVFQRHKRLAKSENKRGFSTSEKARISSRVNTCLLKRLPGE